jgi:hypothetical protein
MHVIGSKHHVHQAAGEFPAWQRVCWSLFFQVTSRAGQTMPSRGVFFAAPTHAVCVAVNSKHIPASPEGFTSTMIGR